MFLAPPAALRVRPSAYAGHDVLEVSLEWMYGAITFLTGVRTLIVKILVNVVT